MSNNNKFRIRSIKENVLLNILYTFTNILFPLITYMYVLRVLSVEAMGCIAFYTSTTNYATMLAALGITTYGIRAVAKVRDDKEKLEQVISELLALNYIATVVVILCYILLVLTVHKFGRDIVLALLNGLIIITTPLGLGWLFSGLEQYEYITKRTLLVKTISLFLILLFVKTEVDYYIYAVILMISSVGTFFLNYFYARKITHFHFHESPNFSRHLKPMLVLFGSALAVSVYFNLDTIMLGFIKDDWEVGIYTTAVRVKTVLLELINAISVVLLPRLSFYLSKGAKESYRAVVKKSMAIIFVISIPMTLFFIIESMPCVLILGGTEYAASSNTMKILMPILVVSGFSNVLGNQILIPSGRENCFLKAVIFGAVIDLIFNFLLMPKYGSVGAAIATLIAEVTQMSIQTYYSFGVLKNNINWSSIIKACIATMAGSVVIMIFGMYAGFGNIIQITLMAIVFFVIYGVLLLVLKEQYSKELVNDFIVRFKQKKQ